MTLDLTPRVRVPPRLCSSDPKRPTGPAAAPAVFSLDPTLSRRPGATAVLSMPWEPLKPYPVGSRIGVLGFTADGTRIPGVDLDHPSPLATDGLEPDESDPQFHQQFVDAALARLGLFRGGVRE